MQRLCGCISSRVSKQSKLSSGGGARGLKLNGVGLCNVIHRCFEKAPIYGKGVSEMLHLHIARTRTFVCDYSAWSVNLITRSSILIQPIVEYRLSVVDSRAESTVPEWGS